MCKLGHIMTDPAGDASTEVVVPAGAISEGDERLRERTDELKSLSYLRLVEMCGL